MDEAVAVTPSPGPLLSEAEVLRLFEQFRPLARRIAAHKVRLLPANVEYADLAQEAELALYQALTRLDSERLDTVEAFVSARIKGAILDYLRALDLQSRRGRSSIQEREQAEVQLTHELGRKPRDSELAELLEVDLGTLQEEQTKYAARIVALGDLVGDDEDPLEALGFLAQRETPEDLCAQHQTLRNLERYLINFEPRLRTVMLRVLEGWTLDDIALSFGVSPTRITQLVAQLVGLIDQLTSGEVQPDERYRYTRAIQLRLEPPPRVRARRTRTSSWLDSEQDEWSPTVNMTSTRSAP